MKNPLVSVICLCYNQVKYVLEALESVINQSYEDIELIIVDDASTDGSKEVINKWLESRKVVSFVNLPENRGNTTAFNIGFALATGKYIIDLAADDVLSAERIEKQVKFFESQNSMVGVIYSDADYIDEKSEKLHRHFDNPRLQPHTEDIYERVIDTYFIPTPTMMIRKVVLDELDGYAESLAYEDFDFWVRSSRNWNYAFQPEVLTLVRKSDNSYSNGWYQQSDPQLHSTYLVCEKIKELNKKESEKQALVRRIHFELRQSAFSGNHREFRLFYKLLQQIEEPTLSYQLLNQLNKQGLNLSIFRSIYHKLRFS